jgi:hypothetical protein
MTSLRLKAVAAALIGTASIVATRCPAQDVTVSPQTALAPADTAPLAVQQMDQLVAPVALYDDPLLVEVLTASSHPVDVVEAQGWISSPPNAALKGGALAAALANQKWDPSVKALVPFSQVLNLMYSHLDWTEHLGDAFVADRAAVMESIQRMRRRAQSAGKLNSSAQQIVVDDGGIVTITPPASEVYIPAYDPWCAYGSWSVSAPLYYTSWPGYCTAEDGTLSFGVGLHPPSDYWEWGNFDWLQHDIRIDHNRFSYFRPSHEPADTIAHQDESHKDDVRYSDAHNVDEFAGPGIHTRAPLSYGPSGTRASTDGFGRNFGSSHFGGAKLGSSHFGGGVPGSGHLGVARFGTARLGGISFSGGHFGGSGSGFGAGHFGGSGIGSGHGGGGHR